MSNLFQRPVEQKYLNELNKNILKEKYEIFSNHFLNPKIQENIRNLNEEQYQGEFLDDLFVKILGYKKNPTPNFNLTTEYKNVKDAKKADGAILIKEKAVAVIELKGTDTTDLGKIESQAFGYKYNQPDCKYIITSNFEKLRFYIENAVNYEEFDLFNLTEERFALLYLCLSRFSIENDIPLKIKKASLIEEEQVTKKLYKDYSNFKHDVYRNIAKQNTEHDKLLLFKKSQKLLDRFLFIFFAEDKQLLPPNTTIDILNQWKDLKDKYDAYVPLIDRFRQYFNYLNTGEKEGIFAYNGGLFAPDEILDTIKIDDTILYNHAKRLSDYDFATEVDVNILGHIFEHSLNELEELQAELEGKVIDKKTSKRKKDGVFYTPKYITKYIVENTVGKLCEEKKTEFDIKDKDYISSKKLKTRKVLLDKLTKYRDWLLQITICDPACGSGAFLNQALEFLIKEHAYIDELTTKISKGTLVIPQDENDILEHNLYGVDINEESVEIAKLSLWLRTARKGRKLSTLSNNIKCGNSLIDDLEVAGDKAFNWQKEFPHIFRKKGVKITTIELEHTPDYLDMIELNAELAKNKAEKSVQYSKEAIKHSKKVYELVQQQKQLVKEPDVKYNEDKGGFDVVIGNPPYVFGGNKGITPTEKNYFKKKYKTGEGKVNLFTLFIEKSNNILVKGGEFSFIIPNTFLRVTSYLNSRKYFIENFKFREIADLGTDVFQSAVTTSIILLATKSTYKKNDKYRIVKDFTGKFSENHIAEIIKNNFIIATNISEHKQGIISKMTTDSVSLGKECKEMIFGVVITKNKDEVVFKNYKQNLKPFLEGKDIGSYYIKPIHSYLKYIPELLHRSRTPKIFDTPEKLLVQRITGGKRPLKVAYDNFGYYNKESINNIILKETSIFKTKFVLTLLNSKLINWFYCNRFTNESTLTVNISKEYLSQIPVKINKEQQQFIDKADIMLSLHKQLQTESNNFLATLTEEKHLETIPKKLINFYELNFEDFKKELKKKKITFTFGSENDKWRKYFNSVSEKAISIKTEIEKTDNEIDHMVYELYGLTEDEIRIVEEG